jgi:UDP-N-acetylmuramate--alanine ligase
MFFRPQHLHFIGIGGIGMSGIAEVLLNLGYQISGSDLKLSATTERLGGLGAKIYEGHAASNIGAAKAVVFSSAIDPQNPELAEARRLKIPLIARGELLAELMRLKYGIAIAGSHGKTTTTSMTATVLNAAGFDPTVVVGGKAASMGGSNARVGQSDFLVVESDESDGSFLKLTPILAVVTNIDREHLDHYPTIVEIRAAFLEFVQKVPFYGAAILCLDDENVQHILPSINRRTITYGRSHHAALQIVDAECGAFESWFAVRGRRQDLGKFRLRVPGMHNVLNATAAIAVGLELDIPVETIRQGLASYTGVDRRFQTRGEASGVTVIDDYGHHPTEIRATLAAAKLCNFGRVLAVFQPHRYTRTQHLLDEFAKSFHQADLVFVLDIYAASEPPIAGVNAELLAQRIRDFGHQAAEYTGGLEQTANAVVRQSRDRDLVLTLGAGNVWQVGDRVLEKLREAA